MMGRRRNLQMGGWKKVNVDSNDAQVALAISTALASMTTTTGLLGEGLWSTKQVVSVMV